MANDPYSDVDVEAESIASNMAIYANYARSYYITYPGTTGTIADGSLGLPSWYNKNTQTRMLFRVVMYLFTVRVQTFVML